MEWLILSLLLVLLVTIVVIARVVMRLSHGLRGLQDGLGLQREIVENRILKSMDSLQHQWLQATSREPSRRRRRKIDAALENLKIAVGLQALEHIEGIVELARISMRPKRVADELLDRLQNERQSPAVRIYLIDAIRRIELDDEDEWNTLDILAQAVITGLKDLEPVIRAYSANLAGHHDFQLDEIEEKLQRLGNDGTEGFAVRRASAWATARLQQRTAYKVLESNYDEMVPDAILPKKRNHFGYVLVKSLESTAGVVEKLLANRPWSEVNKVGVLEGSLIQGAYDVFLKVAAEDQHYFGDFVMNDIQGLPWVDSTHTLPIIGMPQLLYWVRPEESALKHHDAISWVQVAAPSSASALVLLAAREILFANTKLPAIREAAAVYGPAEVMLKFAGEAQEELDTIIKQLHQIPYVTSTVTYRVLEPVCQNHFRWLADDHGMNTQIDELFNEYLIDDDN